MVVLFDDGRNGMIKESEEIKIMRTSKSSCGKRLCALAASLSLAAVCLSALPYGGRGAVAADAGDLHVWTTYNDYTVLQDPESMQKNRIVPPTVLSEDEGVCLSVTMGQGETEGAQLILTPEKDVSSFDLQVSPLTNGEHELGDIEVFFQHYITVAHPDELKYSTVPMGQYPDMLVPLNKAKEYGENKVKAGKNQGITVNFTTTNKTPAGTYSGNFKLIVDGAERTIPVSVTVREIDLTATSNVKVSAAATGTLPAETYDMLMNDYRIMLQYPTQAAYSPQEMVKAVERNWDNPRFTNYDIPNNDVTMFKAFIKELAKASYDSDHNYLTKAVCYLQSIDESENAQIVVDTVKRYTQAKQEVKGELTSYFSSDELRDAIFQAIDDLVVYTTFTALNTSIKVSDFQCGETGGTLCGAFEMFGRKGEILDEFKSESTTPVWIYSNRAWPEIGTSMQNYGQSLRSLGWSMAENDLGGYLFWALATTHRINAGQPADLHSYTSRNYYDDALNFVQKDGSYDFTNVGDGALIYPSKKYGDPDGWYASLRLANFRDGIEDNEALYQLEQRYNELSDRYGAEKKFDDMLSWVYRKGLSTPVSYYADDGKTVYEMRDAVFDLYEAANSSVGLLLEGIEVNGDKATARFYADASSVTVNGHTVAGNGKLFTYTWSLSESARIVIAADGVNFSADVFDYGKIEMPLQTQKIYNTEANRMVTGLDGDGDPAKVVFLSDKKVFKISIDETEDQENPLNAPVFYLNGELFGTENLFDIYYVSFRMRLKFKSEVHEKVPVTVTLNQSEYIERTLASFTIDPADADEDSWITMDVTLKLDYLPLKEAKSIGFAFKSHYNRWYHMGADIQISDLAYTVR